MARKKSRLRGVASVVSKSSTVGRVASTALSIAGLKSSSTRKRRRKTTVASIRKQIELLKAKKELKKLRGY